MSFKSRVVRGIGAGALVATMLVSSTTALAQSATANSSQSDSSARPVAIADNNVHYSGILGPAPSGGSSGKFAYYGFKLDGSSRTITISLQAYPDDQTILNKVSFVVYGPKSISNAQNTYVTSGSTPKVSPNVSGTFTTSDAGDYLIQVRNDSQTTVNWDMWLTGLPPQPASAAQQAAPAATATPYVAPSAPVATSTPVPTTAPSTAAPSTATGASPTATPTAQSGNNFSGDLAPGKWDIFQFDYPGDGRVYTVNVELTPDNRDVLAQAGFEVYKPNGSLQVKGGTQQSLVPNVSANVISQTAGTYMLKVYNNVPGVTVHYTVTLVVGKHEGEK